jgi:hypothetical protein
LIHDGFPLVLVNACPAGAWLAAAVLTLLALLANPLSGVHIQIGEFLGAVLSWLIPAAIAAGIACAAVALAVIALLAASFIVLLILMWRGDG